MLGGSGFVVAWLVMKTPEKRTVGGLVLFWRFLANACMRMSSTFWPMPV